MRSGKSVTSTLFLTITAVLCSAIADEAAATKPTRTTNFNQGWKFHLGDLPKAPVGAAFDDDAWQDVSVPHTLINAHRWMLDGDPKRDEKLAMEKITVAPDDELQSRYHRTVGWYRKTFKLPKDCASRNVFLSFEGVMQTAKVWVNGRLAGEHAISGYTPFHIDITPFVNFGGENTVTVLVDNTLKQDVPPDPHTKDYMQFGGLYRDVHLVITDKLYITFPWEERDAGVEITTPAVAEDEAMVRVRTSVRNSSDAEKQCRLETSILDADGKTVLSRDLTRAIAAGAKHTFDQTAAVMNPHLWHPDHPYLYTVRSRIYDGDTLVDQVENPLGVRWVEFDKKTGFSINGKKLFVDGHCRHHHYPFVGEAVPDRYQRFDAQQIRKAGNAARTSHYPQDPSFLDACDELGLLVLEEPPTWMHRGKGLWMDRLAEAHRRMIRRDRNHPSIISWAVCINHQRAQPELLNAAEEEDPTRQLAQADFALPMCYGRRMPSGGALGSEYPNWCGKWYRWDEASMIDQTRQWLTKLNAMKALPDSAGAFSWVMYDYNTLRNSYFQKAVCPNGLVDQYRIPKYTYYSYQAQHDPNPMVFIANSWSPPAKKGNVNVEVYSNCDTVTLSLNGKSLGAMEQDKKLPKIKHPPFRKSVPFTPGTLEAVGSIDGKVVARYTVKTPGKPVSLQLASDFDTIVADGADWTRIIVSVVDKNGTTVNETFVDKKDKKGGLLPTKREVAFEISGSGKLIGDNPVLVEGGQMVILAQSTEQPGSMTITAKSKGLAPAKLTVRTVAGDKK